MVDALKEIWRLLKPASTLIDLRPRAAKLPLHILHHGETISVGWVDDSRDLVDDTAADEAMAKAVRQGYYGLERKATFPYQMYWDTLEDLTTYVTERWHSVQLDQTTLREAHRLLLELGPKAQLRTHREMRIARYRKRAIANQANMEKL